MANKNNPVNSPSNSGNVPGNSGNPGQGNKPPVPPQAQKNKFRKTYEISIWVSSGVGMYDANLLTTFRQEFQVGPPPHFSESSIDSFINDISANGYMLRSGISRTKYPSHRIDRIEAVEVD
jgi:hypothetical protein